MFLGDLEIHLLMASAWKADGGTMFGAVPKLLWERQKPADGNNLIDASCVAVLVKQRGRVVVCETGIGNKLPEKRARQAHVREPDGLLRALQRLGVRPEEVDLVVGSHLHWDHAGGLTRRAGDGRLELTFPRAKHFFQAREFDFAQQPDSRSSTGFIPDDFLPVAEAGLLETVHGDAELWPGLEVRLTGGHTPGHQVVLFRSGSPDLGCVFTGDLMPMRPHLKVTWNLGYDLDVLRVLQEKARLVDEAARHRWLLVLSHETDQPAGYVDVEGGFQPERRLPLESVEPA